jgi:DNA replication protein DnaC
MITILNKDEDNALLNSFRDYCTKCNHTGYTIGGDALNWCSCYLEYKERKQLIEAGLTARYWSWLPNMDEKFLEVNANVYNEFMNIVDNAENFVVNGESMVLWGPHGSAKTALSCYLLKKIALIRKSNENQVEYKYLCSRVTMAELSNIQLASIEDPNFQRLLRRIEKSDLIIIDEFDKEYKVMDKFRFSGLEFGNLFNYFYERKKSIILISNLSMDEIKEAGIHTPDVLDRVNSFEYQFVFRGESYRTKRKKRS